VLRTDYDHLCVLKMLGDCVGENLLLWHLGLVPLFIDKSRMLPLLHVYYALNSDSKRDLSSLPPSTYDPETVTVCFSMF